MCIFEYFKLNVEFFEADGEYIGVLLQILRFESFLVHIRSIMGHFVSTLWYIGRTF